MAALRAAAYRPVIICALCYGTGVVFARAAFEDGSNAITVVTVRCTFAALAIGLALRASSAIPTPPRERGWLLAIGLLFALNVFTFYKAIELLRVPLAILLFYVYPLLSGAFSALAGLERFNRRTLAFGLVSFAGLALATGAAPESVNMLGVGYALLAAVLIAAILVVSTRYLSHVEAKGRTFWMMASTSAVLICATLAGDAAAWPESSTGWWAIATVCLLYSVGLVALFTSATRIGPLRTSLIMNVEPIIAIGASWLILGQGLAPVQLIGAALVVAGVIGAQMGKRARAVAAD